MITSKQIIKFCEEYSARKNISGKDVVVYKNPTVDDLKEIQKTSVLQDMPEVRFVINNGDNCVYIWDAYLANHDQVYDILHLDWFHRDSDINILFGHAFIKGNKLVPDSSDLRGMFYYVISWIYSKKDILGCNKKLEEFFKLDWSFADKYIVGFNKYLKQIKSELASIKSKQ